MGNSTKGPWSLELLNQVEALWTSGRTAGEILTLLPHQGLTRNSIIGKMNRLLLAKSEGLHDPTKHDLVLRYARMRWTAAQIAAAVNWEPRSVTQFLTVRRKADPTIPLLVPPSRPRKPRTARNVAVARAKAAKGHFEMDRRPEKKMAPAPFVPAAPPKQPLMLRLMDEAMTSKACQPADRPSRPYCEGHMKLMYTRFAVSS
jgi:hypothetical protein